MISFPFSSITQSQYYKSCMFTLYNIATMPKDIKFNLQSSLKLIYPYLDNDTVGVRLKKILIRNNTSIETLSKLLKITPGGIRSYTNDCAYPSPQMILVLYNLFHEKIVCDEYIKLIVSGFSDKLKFWREKNNLTKKAASKILGVGENAYLSWENNKTYISKYTFSKLKDKLYNLMK